MKSYEVLIQELRDIGHTLQMMSMAKEHIDVKKVNDIAYQLSEIANSFEIEFESLENEIKECSICLSI